MNNIRKILGAATPVYIVDEQSQLERNVLYYTNTITDIGDTTLIAAVANKSIVVTNILIQKVNDETNTALNAILKTATIDFLNVYLKNDGDGISMVLNEGLFYKTGVGEALVLNLNVDTMNVLVSIQYYVE